MNVEEIQIQRKNHCTGNENRDFTSDKEKENYKGLFSQYFDLSTSFLYFYKEQEIKNYQIFGDQFLVFEGVSPAFSNKINVQRSNNSIVVHFNLTKGREYPNLEIFFFR